MKNNTLKNHGGTIKGLGFSLKSGFRKNPLFFAAVIGAVVGMVSFAPIWSHHNGQYMDFGDYFFQYIPFIKELKRTLFAGSMSWSWNSFLGDGFINAYSYYTVFNPFAWIVALFPDRFILYGTMFATLVKFSVSMVEYSGSREPLRPLLRATHSAWQSRPEPAGVPMYRATPYNGFTATAEFIVRRTSKCPRNFKSCIICLKVNPRG